MLEVADSLEMAWAGVFWSWAANIRALAASRGLGQDPHDSDRLKGLILAHHGCRRAKSEDQGGSERAKDDHAGLFSPRVTLTQRDIPRALWIDCGCWIMI